MRRHVFGLLFISSTLLGAGCTPVDELGEAELAFGWPPPTPRPKLAHEEGQSTQLLDDAVGLKYVRYAGVDRHGRPLQSVAFVDNTLEVVDGAGVQLRGTALIGVSLWAEPHPTTTTTVYVPPRRTGQAVVATIYVPPPPKLKLTIQDVARSEEVDRENRTAQITNPKTGIKTTVEITRSYLYKVSVAERDASGAYQDKGLLCRSNPPNSWADSNGNAWTGWALAFPQIWEADGWLQYWGGDYDGKSGNTSDWNFAYKNPNGFVFGCMTGAAAKCARVGYWPGRARTAPNGKYLYAYDMTTVHQACVRVFRADYCQSDTRSYTRPGTPIAIFDNYGIREPVPETPEVVARARVIENVDTVLLDRIGARYGAAARQAYAARMTPPSHPSDRRFEAAWSARGPHCMSRTRWADLVPDTSCTWDFIESVPVFGECHSMEEASAKYSWSGLILFNRSDINELPENPFVVPTGGILAK